MSVHASLNHWTFGQINWTHMAYVLNMTSNINVTNDYMNLVSVILPSLFHTSLEDVTYIEMTED